MAKLTASYTPGQHLMPLNFFDINNEKAQEEILKIAAAENDLAISLLIRNFNVTNKSDRVEIAKIEAAQDKGGYQNSLKIRA